MSVELQSFIIYLKVITVETKKVENERDRERNVQDRIKRNLIVLWGIETDKKLTDTHGYRQAHIKTWTTKLTDIDTQLQRHSQTHKQIY